MVLIASSLFFKGKIIFLWTNNLASVGSHLLMICSYRRFSLLTESQIIDDVSLRLPLVGGADFNGAPNVCPIDSELLNHVRRMFATGAPNFR